MICVDAISWGWHTKRNGLTDQATSSGADHEHVDFTQSLRRCQDCNLIWIWRRSNGLDRTGNWKGLGKVDLVGEGVDLGKGGEVCVLVGRKVATEDKFVLVGRKYTRLDRHLSKVKCVLQRRACFSEHGCALNTALARTSCGRNNS